MNLPTLIVDKAARVGDQWRIRYPLLSLHTPKTHSTLLYQPFPHTWPTYTPKVRCTRSTSMSS
jgi:cation diffusion facilitator CzcD-associated flavoprotein CzcO